MLVEAGDDATRSRNTAARAHLARINTDGTLDSTYNPSPNGAVVTLAIQSDGKAIVGGSFGNFQKPGDTTATVRSRVARVNTDGTLDTAFDPNANGTVNAIAVQSDGKILLGGQFTSITPNSATTSTIRLHIARVNTDGTLDTAFDFGAGHNAYIKLSVGHRVHPGQDVGVR